MREEPKEGATSDALKRQNEHLVKLKKANSIIVSALGNSALRAIQSAETPAGMGKSLQERYAIPLNSKKITLRTTLITKKCLSKTAHQDMQNHILLLESLFSRLDKMKVSLDGFMQVSFELATISDFQELNISFAAIETNQPDQATW